MSDKLLQFARLLKPAQCITRAIPIVCGPWTLSRPPERRHVEPGCVFTMERPCAHQFAATGEPITWVSAVPGPIALPNLNNVVFACRKRIQQIGGHLESDANFRSVPRLVVARMKPAADAAMT